MKPQVTVDYEEYRALKEFEQKIKIEACVYRIGRYGTENYYYYTYDETLEKLECTNANLTKEISELKNMSIREFKKWRRPSDFDCNF